MRRISHSDALKRQSSFRMWLQRRRSTRYWQLPPACSDAYWTSQHAEEKHLLISSRLGILCSLNLWRSVCLGSLSIADHLVTTEDTCEVRTPLHKSIAVWTHCRYWHPQEIMALAVAKQHLQSVIPIGALRVRSAQSRVHQWSLRRRWLYVCPRVSIAAN